VQISFSVLFVLKRLRIQFFAWYHKFCVRLRNVVGYSTIVSVTTRKQISDLGVYEFQFWQCGDCSCQVFLRIFGRFEVVFDRPEFDRTQQCLFLQQWPQVWPAVQTAYHFTYNNLFAAIVIHTVIFAYIIMSNSWPYLKELL